MNAPCFKCTERQVNCHASCGKYKEFKALNLQEKITNRLSKQSPYIHRDYGNFSVAEKRAYGKYPVAGLDRA